MAYMTKETLAGYLLEEAIASLLRRSGYRLLQREADDPDALKDAKHGLVVRGRGAKHQADALGDLLTPAPFSLPIRLFVEAKCRKAKTGLADVRNAHGVIHDVNQYYGADAAKHYVQPLNRFQYQYALFSTSGFTADAQAFSLAHQITLVDLSGPTFDLLRSAVWDAADVLRKLFTGAQLGSIPINTIRKFVRARLNPDTNHEPATDGAASGPLDVVDGGLLESWSSWFARRLNAGVTGEGFLIGFPRAPFVLALLPEDMNQLESYVDGQQTIHVHLRFERLTEAGGAGDWVISPAEDPHGFRLHFGLPGAVENWLLASSDARPDANVTNLLSDVTFFLEDRLIRLRFELVRGLEVPGPPPDDAKDDSPLRSRLGDHLDREVIDESRLKFRFEPAMSAPSWTLDTVQRLMERLRLEAPAQFEAIRAAVQRDGDITRSMVYQVAGFERDRTLRGFTRPTRRITSDLVAAGLLSADAPEPLEALYEDGPRASHFLVAREIIDILRPDDDP